MDAEIEDVRAWEVLGYPNEEAMLLAEIGRTRKQSIEEVKAIGYVLTNRVEQRGESADYLTARIARDRPDILEKMRDR